MANRFRDPILRKAYDEATINFESGYWTRDDGSPHRCATHRDAFWGGYYNDRRPPVKASIAYACYRAGQDVANKIKASRK